MQFLSLSISINFTIIEINEHKPMNCIIHIMFLHHNDKTLLKISCNGIFFKYFSEYNFLQFVVKN